jgi:hypothetical protein
MGKFSSLEKNYNSQIRRFSMENFIFILCSSETKKFNSNM